MSSYLINRHSGETVYSQISRILLQDLREHYEVGACLPSETDLAEQFSVNRHTVRRAIDDLVLDGLVERRHGLGTYVVAKPIDYPIHRKTCFTTTLELKGKKTACSIIRKTRVPARGGVAEKLRLNPYTEVVLIETLRLAEGEPLCLVSHFLNLGERAAILDGYQADSLHAYLNDHGIALIRQQSLISAVLPQGDDAQLLGMPRSLPILRVKSVNLDAATNKPVEYAVTRFRSDSVQLQVDF